MLYEISIGLLSIIGLLFGAELVIDKARRIAHKLKISDFFIGLTIFSIGTSLPEIATHIITSMDILRGVDYATMSGLAVGTNVGSNIIQITLITGIVAFFGVLRAKRKFLNVDYVVMLGSIIVLFVFSLDGQISRLEGAIMFFSYMIYLWYLIKQEKFDGKIIDGFARKQINKDFYVDTLLMVGGLILLLLSADRIAELAQFFSKEYNISGSIIGTLIVGVTTALPETTTSIFALRKKASGMSLGTLVGSNITNPLMGIGIGAMISTYGVENSILWYDIPFWFGISFILWLAMLKTRKLTHVGGLFLMAAYVLFVIIRIWFI